MDLIINHEQKEEERENEGILIMEDVGFFSGWKTMTFLGSVKLECMRRRRRKERENVEVKTRWVRFTD